MKFDTKIWHPNVSSVTGAICLDILKKEWSPALSVRTALLSIQALMCCPEPTNPQDAQVASQYLNNKDQFNKQAKDWVNTYANIEALHATKIQKLTDMGFTEAQAKVSAELTEGSTRESFLGRRSSYQHTNRGITFKPN